MQNKYRNILSKLVSYSLSGILIQCVVFASAFASPSARIQQQEVTVTGRVTGTGEGESGGLPGVNVVVKGTTFGTSTDAEGRYAIQVPANGTLVFSFIGYATQEVA